MGMIENTSIDMDQSSDDDEDFIQSWMRLMPRFGDEVCDPITAMNWIPHMEHIFKGMKCADDEEERVVYGASMLRSKARSWWDKVKYTSGLETITKMTWSEFKEAFKEEFCPIRMEMALVEEHMTLKQGRNETLQEFIIHFERLWWFVWHYLTPEKRFIYKFVWGSRPDIKDFILPPDMITFEKTVQAALIIEEINNRQLKAMNNLKRKRKSKSRTNCRKRHWGECRYCSKGCYHYGKIGHLARECRSTDMECFN